MRPPEATTPRSFAKPRRTGSSKSQTSAIWNATERARPPTTFAPIPIVAGRVPTRWEHEEHLVRADPAFQVTLVRPLAVPLATFTVATGDVRSTSRAVDRRVFRYRPQSPFRDIPVWAPAVDFDRLCQQPTL